MPQPQSNRLACLASQIEMESQLPFQQAGAPDSADTLGCGRQEGGREAIATSNTVAALSLDLMHWHPTQPTPAHAVAARRTAVGAVSSAEESRYASMFLLCDLLQVSLPG